MTDKIGPNTGNRGKGRPKGALNKTTRIAKDAIAFVFDELGGAEAMVTWAQSDPDNLKAFYTSIYPKLLPLQLTGGGEGDAPVSIGIRFVDA